MEKKFLMAFLLAGLMIWSQSVGAISDLAITNVYTIPQNPSIGQDANAYIVLKNLGNQASHDFNLTLNQLWRGDQNVGTPFSWLNQTKLFPQQERTIVQPMNFFQNGNWESSASFVENRDSNGWPQDANWNNNSFTRYMNVGAIQTDPMVSQLVVSRYGPPLQVLIEFNVKNNSPGGLGTSPGAYQITAQRDYNTVVIATGEFHALLPSEEYAIQRYYTAPQSGYWTFTATIFPYNVDANLSNNSRAQTIQLDSNTPAPDITWNNLSLNYKQGGYARFKMFIKNSGTQNYQGALFHQFAVYTYPQHELVQENIYNDTNTPFPVGQQYTYYPSFANLPNGTYSFGAKVDYYNDVNELNENNNDTGIYWFTIIDSNYSPMPNIRFSESLAVVDVNGQKNLRIKYVLDGNQSIGSFASKITGAGQDANSINYFTTQSMQPGVVLTHYQPLNFLDHNRMVRVDLDYNNSIQESNENDNTAIIFVDLNQQNPKPNLFIERIYLLSIVPHWKPDVNFAWAFIVVKNNGQADAGTSTLRLDANVVKDGNITMLPSRFLPTAAIPTGKRTVVRTRFDRINGQLRLLAMADYYNVVDESNENDNWKTFP